MTRRRWIADSFSPEIGHPTHAALTGDQAAHLARVLRAERGQVFDVVAGGFLHRAEITSVSPDRVEFLLHEELESDAALPLHLYLAVFKFDHFEWAVEKATELGVARITPVLARRTEKHLAQASAKRVDRWRRIASEAAQQSRRTQVPEIADPVPLRPAIEVEQAATRILLSETEQTVSLREALRANLLKVYSGSRVLTPFSPKENGIARPFRTPQHQEICSSPGLEVPSELALAIGPEGGWTADEMALFTERAWTHVTLGQRILRAETAAIAAVAIVGSLLG